MLSHNGWTWRPDDAALACPNDKLAKFVGVNVATSAGFGTIRFMTAKSDCKACPIRSDCTPSTAHDFRKEKAIKAPISTTEAVAKLWQPKRMPPRTSPKSDRAPPRVATPMRWVKPVLGSNLALLAVAYAILLPAMLRRIFKEACRDTDVSVTVEETAERRKPCLLYATTPAERQKRRLTWAEKIARNELPSDTRVSIHVAVGDTGTSRFTRESPTAPASSSP